VGRKQGIKWTLGGASDTKKYLTGVSSPLYLAQGLVPPGRKKPLIPLPSSSFISSSSKNCGGRLQPPPHPGPGPAPRSQPHLKRRSHLGQVMVRRVGYKGQVLVDGCWESWHYSTDGFCHQVPVLPPVPDSSGEPRGPRLCSLGSFRRPQIPRKSLAIPLALTESTPQVSIAYFGVEGRNRKLVWNQSQRDGNIGQIWGDGSGHL
jgi:hypothetical protein